MEIYINIKERLLEGVRGNLERKPLTEAELQEQLGAEKLVEKLASSQPERKVVCCSSVQFCNHSHFSYINILSSEKEQH